MSVARPSRIGDPDQSADFRGLRPADLRRRQTPSCVAVSAFDDPRVEPGDIGYAEIADLGGGQGLDLSERYRKTLMSVEPRAPSAAVAVNTLIWVIVTLRLGAEVNAPMSAAADARGSAEWNIRR